MALAAPAALAATSYQAVDMDNPDGQETEDRWGERTAAANLNGDGPDDLLVGVPFHDVNGTTDAGKVYAIDGSELPNDPTEPRLYDVNPDPQKGANFGSFLSVLGDVDGDGKDDYVVGASNYTTNETPGGDEGKAWILSGGKDGGVLFELTSPDPESGASFAERTGRAGDIDGDGVPDAIIGEPQQNIDGKDNVGRAYVFSGSDGSLLRTLNSPTQEGGAQFGKAVQSPGDLGSMASAGEPSTSKDDVPDLFVNAVFADAGGVTDAGQSYLFSGGDDFDNDQVLDGQEELARIDAPQGEHQGGALFGFQDVEPLAPGDVAGQDSDGDGVGEPDGTPDLYAAAFHQDVDNENQGRAWVFDGAASIEDDTRNGVPLYELDDPQNPQPGGSFGWSMSGTDYNPTEDSIPDLYVGQAPHAHSNQEPSGGNGGTYVFDGTDQDVTTETEDAAVHKKLDLPAVCRQSPEDDNRAPALGWSNATPGDVDNDDQADYVAGAPFTDLPTKSDTKDAGVVIFFGSNTSKNMDDCE